jgi:zinc and cadmium transporter
MVEFSVLLWSVAATFFVSMVSVIGLFGLGIKTKVLDKILFLLVGLSAGALMGDAFIHLIPEAIPGNNIEIIFMYVIVGFSLFFVMERLLSWHHCHEHGGCKEEHSFSYMNLVGEGVHNFIDGLVIAGSFSAGTQLGIATTTAVLIHEIPQEIGNFGVLVYGGFSKLRALTMNLLFALSAMVGAVAGVFLVSAVGNMNTFLLPFTAGGFIYISASDLIPELHKEPKLRKSILAFLFFLIGITFMYAMKALLG